MQVQRLPSVAGYHQLQHQRLAHLPSYRATITSQGENTLEVPVPHLQLV
jgi:hypothetical protein